MKRTFRSLVPMLLLSAVAVWAGSQQNMTVVVVNAHADPLQPVPGVRVSLTYLDGTTRISDSRDVTNRQGEAWLLLSPEVQQRGELCLEVTGASNLVIYQPAGGVLPGATAKVTIQLLPKGSPLLKGPAQIEAMLYRYSQQIHKLQAQVSEAQPQKPDFARDLQAWAAQNGFSYEEADREVRSWADGIQKQKDRATLRQKMLAELAQRNYDAVIQLAGQGMDASGEDLDAAEKAYLEAQRKALREYLSWANSQANAYRLKLQYHQATAVLEKARERAAREHQRYPEDVALRGIWLSAFHKAVDARIEEGNFGSAADSLALLARSVEDYRLLLQEHSSPDERKAWAMTQMNMGIALARAGDRGNGESSRALLAQAVEAYRKTLEVATKADWPDAWATVQNNLGNALLTEGEIVKGEESIKLLEQAVQAYRNALEIHTRTANPEEWAMAQNNLGVALEDEAERVGGADALRLSEEAVQAYQRALEVRTRADLPQDWARTQGNMGAALDYQGQRATGDRALELLAQAVQAYQGALELYTKTDLPQDWANTQSSLGNTFLHQATRSGDEKAVALLEQAVQAYQRASRCSPRLLCLRIGRAL